MKYTVILAEPVPVDVRDELARRLASRFNLSSDQAQKLAARSPGRLLKPTSRERAEALHGLYEALGLRVTLEQIKDDGGQLPSARQTSISTVPIDMTARQPTLAPTQPAAAEPTARFSPPAPETPVGPVAVAPEVPAAPAARPAPVWLDATTPEPAPPAISVSRPTATMSSDAPAPITPSQLMPDATFTDEAPTDAGGTHGRRTPLARRILLTAVAPLAAATIVTLGFLALVLPASQTALIREGAQAIAAGIGTSIEIENQDSINLQLRELVRQPSIGFVSVETPEGLNYFLSKREEADWKFGDEVLTWIRSNQGASSYVQRDRPADRYREQLMILDESGATTDQSRGVLQSQLSAAEANRTTTTHYELQRIGVYVETDAAGNVRKVAGPPTAQGGKRPDYTVTVGVISDASRALVTRSLLLIFGMALLAFAVAAYFAVRTSRQVVEPIERLVKAADAISLGQLATPVTAERNDEIGDLARALERMRLSLEAAMERLRRRRNR